MNVLKLFFGFVLLLIFETGCQTVPYQGYAREVKKKPQDSGVIALNMNYVSEDQAVAQQKMASNCSPQSFKVLEEGEVVVGTTTRENTENSNHSNPKAQVGTLFGLPVVSQATSGSSGSSTATTTGIKEWQISYQCVQSTSLKK